MILKQQSPSRKMYHIGKRPMASREPSAPKEPSISKEFVQDLVPYTNKRPMVTWIDPCKVDGYISLPGRWMTLTDREAYRRVLRGLTYFTRIFLYGNILRNTHKDPIARFSPSYNEEYPQDLDGINSTFSL